MKDLLAKVFNEFKTTQWFSIVTLTSLVSVFIFAGWMGIKDDSLYNKARPYIPVLIFMAYTFSFFWPIVRLSKKEGHKALGIISCWALFSLTLFGYCLYFFLLNAFHYLKPDDQSKLLNLPPVLIALLGALFGLYVNYQVNSKNQKLKSAFDLMMSTRTSTEFAKNVTALRKVYPPGLEIPVSVSGYFFSGSEEKPDPFNDDTAAAIAGLKYLLNFYEYIAVWINHDEVDEDLIYEVTASSIISLHDKSLKIVQSSRDHNPLQGKQLDKLVSRWKVRKEQELQAMKQAKSGNN